MQVNTANERYVVNIGGRSKRHYDEAQPIAEAAAEGVARAQQALGSSLALVGKNGGLGGSMEAFGEAYKAKGIQWVPVLTSELDCPEYAPLVARSNPHKKIEGSNTQRLETIIKHRLNKLLVVTAGGSGTLEELAAAICEIEWRIKWPKEALAEPFRILIAGDEAVRMWRPVLQAVFCQLADTHPLVERSLLYVSTEYVGKGLLVEEVFRALTDG
jgi:predicted Rossmann-fold nucleotide-binding protein